MYVILHVETFRIICYQIENGIGAINLLVQIEPTYVLRLILHSSYEQLCIELGENQIIELSGSIEFTCLGFAQVVSWNEVLSFSYIKFHYRESDVIVELKVSL